MADTTQAPTPATIHRRFFSAPLLDAEAYAAGFAAVRRALPVREAEDATVVLFPAHIRAFLRAEASAAPGGPGEEGR